MILEAGELFSDNWIYVHEPEVSVARIQNFKNWSPRYDDVIDGCVFRVPKSYPVYDADYAAHVDTIRGFVARLENCKTVGRNGLHRYNNQDHSMLTGLYAARSLALGETHDLWSVNADAEYHEEVREGSGSMRAPSSSLLGRALGVLLAKIDPVGLGVALGAVAGATLFSMTNILVLKGGVDVGATLSLLGQYLPGYHVSFWGSVLGLIYGVGGGFVIGWSIAQLRNRATYTYVKLLRHRAARAYLRSVLDDV